MVKQSKISTFWITFLAILVAVSIGVVVYTQVVCSNKVAKMQMSVINDENVYKIGQENIYKQSLYQACDNLKQMDLLLGKVAVSNSAQNQAQMLCEITVCSQSVEQCLSNLPIAVSDNYYDCQQFANQMGDYSNYLVGQLAVNGKLTASQQANLGSMDKVAAKLCNTLTEYSQGDAGMFVTNGSGADGNGTLAETINNLPQESLQYNQLDYSGNYSQPMTQTKIICGKDIGEQKLTKIANELLGECKFVDTMMVKNCKLYDFDTQNGRAIFTQDGNLLTYQSYNESSSNCSLSSQDAMNVAQEFCAKVGYNVVPTFLQQTLQNDIFVYCYPVVDGVVLYPQSVIVEVDCASQKAVGIQAKGYLTYIQQQSYTFGDIDQEQALKTVSSTLKVDNTTKVLYQKYDKNYLCYQFEGRANGNKYLVLVDSVTGNEIDIICLDDMLVIR